MGPLLESWRLLRDVPWWHRPAAIVIAVVYHLAMGFKRWHDAQEAKTTK